jgi:hypothetical protein
LFFCDRTFEFITLRPPCQVLLAFVLCEICVSGPTISLPSPPTLFTHSKPPATPTTQGQRSFVNSLALNSFVQAQAFTLHHHHCAVKFGFASLHLLSWHSTLSDPGFPSCGESEILGHKKPLAGPAVLSAYRVAKGQSAYYSLRYVVNSTALLA